MDEKVKRKLSSEEQHGHILAVQEYCYEDLEGRLLTTLAKEGFVRKMARLLDVAYVLKEDAE